eukprot:CAMPEP_0114542156 /NCGR_PEP_ID=MMETSP0114-20121206/1690_1 /TAXON_ID=31324 /ORGANISM="Goniomonas sp, Strain m" /LENGTH=298 /DNA_ID=CAMNT_0001726445 /DNA_START=55 /DNA_END=948 /DNA_ORIENTATION=-
MASSCESLDDFACRFNANPKTAIADLDPRVAAQRLFEAHPRIDTTLLGQLLGGHSETSKGVLQHFPSFYKFRGVFVLDALRQFLWRFRLPGEAAQIDRIMEAFAKAYFEQNARSDDPALQKNFGTSIPSWVHGWYRRQILCVDSATPSSKPSPCCIDCGSFDRVICCHGCERVWFCRACSRLAVRRGHAVVAKIGYGRACVAARACESGGELPTHIDFDRDGKNHRVFRSLDHGRYLESWQPGSPFASQDAIYVFAFAFIMLSTDLHNPSVKNKMQLHQFIKSLRGTNDGANLPVDFL